MDYEAYAAARVESHEIIGPWEPMIVAHDIDMQHKILFVEVDGSILTGTDAACALFGQMMKHLTESGYLVYLLNDGWVPSKYKFINHAWATVLAEEAGDPLPYIPAE